MMHSVSSAVANHDPGGEGEFEDVSSDEELVAVGPSGNVGGYQPKGLAPVLAPKGLAGLLEGRSLGATEPLDTSRLPANVVLVNVYDVGDSELLQKINRATTGNNSVLIAGVFHAGIEVYGREWGYGSTEEDRTGLGACAPRTHPQHSYRATVVMGNTRLNNEQVTHLVARLALDWRGPEYHLIHKNCLNFCNAFLGELGLGRLPGWIDRASRTASQLDKAVKLVRTISAEEVQGQAAEVLEKLRRDSVEAIEGFDSASVLEDENLQAVHAKAKEIGGKAQEHVEALGNTVMQALSAADESPEMAVVTQTVNDIRDKAQEQVQMLHSNLMSWEFGRSILQNVHGEGKQPEGPRKPQRPRQPQQANSSPEANFQPEPRALQQDHTLQTPPKKQPVKNPDLLSDTIEETSQHSSKVEPTVQRDLLFDDFDDAPTAMEIRSDMGLIRTKEEQKLCQSLLAEEDEEEDLFDFQLGGPSSRAQPRQTGRTQPTRPKMKVVEVPEDWLSGPALATTSSTAPTTSAVTTATDVMSFVEDRHFGGCSVPSANANTSAALFDLLSGDVAACDSLRPVYQELNPSQTKPVYAAPQAPNAVDPFDLLG